MLYCYGLIIRTVRQEWGKSSLPMNIETLNKFFGYAVWGSWSWGLRKYLSATYPGFSGRLIASYCYACFLVPAALGLLTLGTPEVRIKYKQWLTYLDHKIHLSFWFALGTGPQNPPMGLLVDNLQ